jgi:hypothetical protein
MADELPAALAAIDPDGQVVFVNREAAERLPGAAGWLGRSLHEALPAPLAAGLLDAAQHELPVDLDGRRFRVARRRIPGRDSTAASLLLIFTPLH